MAVQLYDGGSSGDQSMARRIQYDQVAWLAARQESGAIIAAMEWRKNESTTEIPNKLSGPEISGLPAGWITFLSSGCGAHWIINAFTIMPSTTRKMQRRSLKPGSGIIIRSDLTRAWTIRHQMRFMKASNRSHWQHNYNVGFHLKIAATLCNQIGSTSLRDKLPLTASV